MARERNKQLELAEAEYRLYLKLYPQGEGAERVRQRHRRIFNARFLYARLSLGFLTV